MQLETWIFHLLELRFDVFLGVRDFAGSLPTKNSRESVFRFFLSSGVDTRMTQFEAGLGGSFCSGRRGLVKGKKAHEKKQYLGVEPIFMFQIFP